MKTSLYTLILSLVLFFSACSKNKEPAKASSIEAGYIYSSDAPVDQSVPNEIVAKVNTTVSFPLVPNVTISDYGDINQDNVTISDNTFNWQVNPKDIGHHTIELQNTSGAKQSLNIYVFSKIEKPTKLTISQGDSPDEITITSYQYHGFDLYFALNEDGPYSLLSANNNDYNYHHNPSAESKKLTYAYYYKIQGFDADGQYSELSAPTKGYLKIPDTYNVRASLDTKGVSLQWEDMTANIEYNIYRADNCSDNYVKIDATPSWKNHFLDENVNVGSLYCYKVVSGFDGLENNVDQVNAVHIVYTQPSPEYFVAKYDVNASSAVLSWSKVAEGSTYVLYKNDVELAQTTELSYVDTNISESYTTYAITATNAGYTSDKKYATFEKKLFLSASEGFYDDKIALKWDALNGATAATRYDIYQSTQRRGTFTKVATTANTYYNIDTSINRNQAYLFKIVTNDTNATESIVVSGYKGNIEIQEETTLGGNNADIAFSNNGDLYNLSTGGVIYQTLKDGTQLTVATNSEYKKIAFDSQNNLYVLAKKSEIPRYKNKFTVYKKDANSTTFVDLNQSIYDVKGFDVYEDAWYCVGYTLNVNTTEFSSLQAYKNGNAIFNVHQDGYATAITHDMNANLYVSYSYDGSRDEDNVYKYTASGDESLFLQNVGQTIKAMLVDEKGIFYFVNRSVEVYDLDGNYIYSYSPTFYGYFNAIAQSKGIISIATNSSILYSLKEDGANYSVDSIAATASFEGNSIHLNWNGTKNLQNYTLYRSVDNNTSYVEYATNLQENSFVDTNITNKNLYFYKVSTQHYGGLEQNSTADYGFTGVLPPKDLNASKGIYEDKINLSWTNFGSLGFDVTYNFYRSLSLDGNYSLVGSKLSLANQTIDDTSLAPNTNYYYKMQSNFLHFMSDFSNIDYGFKKPLSPSKVTTKGTISTITLSWDKVATNSTYEIFGSDDNTTFSSLGTTQDLSFTDDSLTYLEMKYYKVLTSYNGILSAIDGNNSKIVSGTATVAPPSEVNASKGAYSDRVRISWSKNINADGYSVYRSDSEKGTYSLLDANISASTFVYEDSSALVNTPYYYHVRSTYQGSEGSASPSEFGYIGNVAVAEIFKSGFGILSDIAVDSKNNIFAIDSTTDIVYKIAPDKTMVTFSTGYHAPRSIAIDSNDNIYVLDIYIYNMDKIYKLNASGEKTVLDSFTEHGTYIAFDRNNQLYVSDDYDGKIYKIDPSGIASSFISQLSNPKEMAFDTNNTIYFVDDGRDKVFKKYMNEGTLIVLDSSITSLYGVGVDKDANTYVSDYAKDIIYKISPSGVKTEFLTSISNPGSIIFDNNGVMYISSNSGTIIYKVLRYTSKVPSGLMISSFNHLSWNVTDGVSAYKIYASVDANSTFTNIATVNNTYYHIGNQTYHYFKVQGLKSDGTPTDFSNIVHFGSINIDNDTRFPWRVDSTQVDHNSSYESTNKYNSSTSCISTSIDGKGILKYSWKVSSESSYDFLQFYSGTNNLEQHISGSTTWSDKTYTQTQDGLHQYKWCYSKDGSQSSGEDAGWVDNIEFVQ